MCTSSYLPHTIKAKEICMYVYLHFTEHLHRFQFWLVKVCVFVYLYCWLVAAVALDNVATIVVRYLVSCFVLFCLWFFDCMGLYAAFLHLIYFIINFKCFCILIIVLCGCVELVAHKIQLNELYNDHLCLNFKWGNYNLSYKHKQIHMHTHTHTNTGTCNVSLQWEH